MKLTTQDVQKVQELIGRTTSEPVKTLKDFYGKVVENEHDYVGMHIAESQYGEYTVKRLLQESVGKTISSAKYVPDGAKYCACITLLFTDGTGIEIESTQGDTEYFHSLRMKETNPGEGGK